MKKSLSVMPWIVFAAAFVFSGCAQKENNPPADVSFTEYSLSGTDCEWTNLNYSNDGDLTLIDSEEELNNYVNCPEESTIPPVDFSKHTLILSFGLEFYQNLPDYLSFQQDSTQSYVMHVNLKPSAATVVTKWQTAIVTAKLDEKSNVKLRVTRDIQQ